MPQAATTSNSRLPAARSAMPEVRFSRGIRAATIAQAEGGVIPSWNEEDLSFEFVLASETPCRSYRYSPDGRECVDVDEVLSMEGLEDVDKLVGASILDQHNTYSLRNVYGVIVEARVEGTQLVCRGRLWDREDIADVVDGVRQGILRNFSVGFERFTETFEERAGKPPLVTVTSWQAVEGSIVTVPADPTAQTRAAGAKPTPQGARRTPSPAPAKRNAAMATKPTKAQRAAAEAVSEAEAALAIAESNVDEARKAAGLPARAKRDDAEASGDEGERDGDAENQGDDAEGGSDAGATAEKDEKKRAAAAAAEKRSALVEGLRTVARRRGKEALDDFEAIAAAGGSLDELRAAAVAAVRSKAAPITSTAGGVRAPDEKPELRSFRDTAIGKRGAR